jgi:hypothetical protein
MNGRISAVTAIVILVVLLPCPLAAQSLRNGGFEAAGSQGGPRDWVLAGPEGSIRRAEGEGVNDGSALRMDGGEEYIFAGQAVDGVGEGRAVFVECRARCENLAGYAGIWILGKETEDYEGSNLALLKGTTGWLTLTVGFRTSPGFKSLYVKLGAKGSGTVWFDDVVLRTGEEAEKASASSGPNPAEANWGIFRVQARYRVEVLNAWKGQRVLLPMPLARDGQSPLAAEVVCDPPHAMTGWKPRCRSGANWVADVELAGGPEGETFELALHAYVLAAFRDYKALDGSTPLDRYGSIPKEFKTWLEASAIVQAGDPALKEWAGKIGGKTVGELVKGLGRVMGEIEGGYGREFGNRWDAVSGLKERTGCCGQANLAAALFRSLGVPARILAGYPAWSGSLATHYVVEYYVPGFGWAIYDSASGLDRAHPSRQINVSEVTIADENASRKRPVVAGQWFWFGVPANSVTEIEGEMSMRLRPAIGGSDGEDGTEHAAAIHRLFPKDTPVADQNALVDAASARWNRLIKRGDSASLRVDSRIANARDAAALKAALGN